jgi:hypothetical protein
VSNLAWPAARLEELSWARRRRRSMRWAQAPPFTRTVIRMMKNVHVSITSPLPSVEQHMWWSAFPPRMLSHRDLQPKHQTHEHAARLTWQVLHRLQRQRKGDGAPKAAPPHHRLQAARHLLMVAQRLVHWASRSGREHCAHWTSTAHLMRVRHFHFRWPQQVDRAAAEPDVACPRQCERKQENDLQQAS